VPEEILMQAQDDRRSTMLDLARRWRDSGGTARAFAQEHGITTWTLYYWRKRLARDERPARRRRRMRRVRLAPVHVVASAEGNRGDLEVLLASGDRVRVPPEVSADTLRRVVEVLRTAC
jgi:transposase-like protein